MVSMSPGDMFRRRLLVAYRNHESKNFRMDKRVEVLEADQSNITDLNKIADRGPFDIILDDGSHVPSHMNLTFQVLWQVLLPGGVYIIEDIETDFWRKDAKIYGYPLMNETSIMDVFLKMVKEEVNAEFTKGFDSTDKEAILFSRNNILIKKREKGSRKYRFFRNLPDEIRRDDDRYDTTNRYDRRPERRRR